MKNNKHVRILAVVIILLSINLFTWINSPSIQEIRNVDFLKIFSLGLLVAALGYSLKEIFLAKKVQQ